MSDLHDMLMRDYQEAIRRARQWRSTEDTSRVMH